MIEGPPRLFTIPPGAPFLTTLAEALLGGRLVEGLAPGDPLALADATIYLPTRRAARELRSVFVGLAGGGSAILPTIKALGEFDETGAMFDGLLAESLDLAPPIGEFDRLLLLAEPTQGVDVGAKEEIHRIISHLADDGAAVLVTTSDLGEVLRISDRILVMREGRIVAEFGPDATQVQILAAAAGDEQTQEAAGLRGPAAQSEGGDAS